MLNLYYRKGNTSEVLQYFNLQFFEKFDELCKNPEFYSRFKNTKEFSEIGEKVSEMYAYIKNTTGKGNVEYILSDGYNTVKFIAEKITDTAGNVLVKWATAIDTDAIINIFESDDYTKYDE